VGNMLGELEGRLDPRQFIRIHLGTLVSLAWVEAIEGRAGGSLRVRLRGKGMELEVARERVRGLKERFML
jgi:DNA-binding LytR/AlgR family response regulator